MTIRKLMLVAAILLAVPLLAVPAQASGDTHRDGDEATLVGCLTQAVSYGDDLSFVPGTWVLTDTETGDRVLVKGEESLEDHDANHKVEVHGNWVVDPNPHLTHSYDDYLMVDEFKHIADTCDAPSNPDEGIG